jgi:hypothetical protein
VAVGGDIDINPWTQHAFTVGTIWTAVVYTRIDVAVPGKFRGHGTAFGIGFGLMQLTGSLNYDSEDALLSAENTMLIISLAGLTVVKFRINGQPVGALTFASVGFGTIETNGTFIWT